MTVPAAGRLTHEALPPALVALAGALGVVVTNVVSLVDGQPAPSGAPAVVVRAVAGVKDGFQLALPDTGGTRPLSFGVRLSVTGVVQWLRMGYHSWDGSAYEAVPVPADDDGGVPGGTASERFGFALTQLASNSGFLHLGFVRHDRLQHRFRMRRDGHEDVLDIEVMWDRRAPFADAPGHVVSEPFVVGHGAAAEPLLRAWAETVAASGPAPRAHRPITGWCSWYNLYAGITEDNLREHLVGVRRVADEDHLAMPVFQIDDGFTPEMGDWLKTRPTFPRGMPPLLREVRDAGFVPGLWMAPFLVGNRSDLYAEHPDWVVVDRLTDAPYVCMEFYGEFRWHKRSEEYYVLDTTHPEAMAYLRRVVRTWRREWGCRYVKTDFMFYAAEHGPDRVRRHREGSTRVEVFVEALEAIREELGDATWLGCGIPLWMAVGWVDAVRIGRDVGAEWDTGVRAEQHFENLSLRSFASPRLWLADPDCVLLRERYNHLSDDEVHTLALTAGMTGGVLMTSDNLASLGPERRELWAFVLSLTGARCEYPLLGRTTAEGLFVQWRPADHLLHVVNPGSRPVSASIAWADLGLGPAATIGRALGPQQRPAGDPAAADQPATALTRDETGIRVELEPHGGLLFHLLADRARPATSTTRS